MMPYAVFGLTKVAKEHGIWASDIAKKILLGASPSEFPVESNRLSNSWINESLANKINFYPDSTLRSQVLLVSDIPQ